MRENAGTVETDGERNDAFMALCREIAEARLGEGDDSEAHDGDPQF